jgi:hypothetical protein
VGTPLRNSLGQPFPRIYEAAILTAAICCSTPNAVPSKRTSELLV